MIVDGTGLLAIVFRDPGHEAVLDRLMAADAAAAGTPTLAETGIVLRARLDDAADGMLERMLDELGIQVARSTGAKPSTHSAGTAGPQPDHGRFIALLHPVPSAHSPAPPSPRSWSRRSRWTCATLVS